MLLLVACTRAHTQTHSVVVSHSHCESGLERVVRTASALVSTDLTRTRTTRSARSLAAAAAAAAESHSATAQPTATVAGNWQHCERGQRNQLSTVRGRLSWPAGDRDQGIYGEGTGGEGRGGEGRVSTSTKQNAAQIRAERGKRTLEQLRRQTEWAVHVRRAGTDT